MAIKLREFIYTTVIGCAMLRRRVIGFDQQVLATGTMSMSKIRPLGVVADLLDQTVVGCTKYNAVSASG
jgi:hypothetical protein